MDVADRLLWRLGWEPRALNIAGLAFAGAGWVLFRSPWGMVAGVIVAVLLRWKTSDVINKASGELIREAVERVKQEGASRMSVQLSAADAHPITTGQGTSPFFVKAKPEYDISVIYIADAFFAVYAGASLTTPRFEVEAPGKGEEIYFRHVSAITYQDPMLEVVLATGRSTRRFNIGSLDRDASVLEALRLRLRGAHDRAMRRVAASSDSVSAPIAAEPPAAVSGRAAASASEPPSAQRTEPTLNGAEERYCYLRCSKLMQLYHDPVVLDALLVQLDVPGKTSVLKQLTEREKQEAIETQIDHFRRTPTSVWHAVPTYEVLAASIWRAQFNDSRALRPRIVREIFARVSQEEDLLRPVAKWLLGREYEPYMEVPLGRRRIDVLGHRAGAMGRSPQLCAVELKNDDNQFARGIDQMGTFAEYAHTVYLACTPAFCAEYLDKNVESRGVRHWDPGVLERKLTSGGFGLLVVERDTVYEVLKPVERAPSPANIAATVKGLSTVRRVEC